MGYWNPQNVKEEILRNPSQPHAGIGESMISSFNLQQDQRTFMAAESAIYDEYEVLRRTYQKALGKQPGFNPFSAKALYHTPTGERSIQPPTPTVSHQLRDAYEAKFFDEITKLSQEHPELDLPVLSPDAIREKIGRDRALQRAEAADIGERTFGFVDNAASFLGAAAGAIADPPVALSMLFGYGWSTTVLRGALTDAGIGALSESVVQLDVQSGRQQFGEEADVIEGLATVGLAGVGGGLFSAGLRGGVKGTKALVARSRAMPARNRPPKVRAAENYLARIDELQDANPFPEGHPGRIQHQENFNAALARITHTDTAIGRVLGARDPQRIEVAEVDFRTGEPVESFFQRLREANPQLFHSVDRVGQVLARATERLQKVQDELALPVDAESAAQLAQLKANLAKATDRRKAKRLSRQIAELEARSGADIEKVVKKSRARQRKLAKEEKKLNKEIKKLEAEQDSLTVRVDRAAQRMEPRSQTSRLIQAKVIIGRGNDPTSVASRNMVDFGALIAEAVQRNAPNAPVRLSSTTSSRLLSPAEQADIKARDEALETTTRELISENPEARMEITDEQGNIISVTGEKFLDDLADDEVILKELRDCAAGALT
jgi:hypothetical protein